MIFGKNIGQLVSRLAQGSAYNTHGLALCATQSSSISQTLLPVMNHFMVFSANLSTASETTQKKMPVDSTSAPNALLSTLNNAADNSVILPAAFIDSPGKKDADISTQAGKNLLRILQSSPKNKWDDISSSYMDMKKSNMLAKLEPSEWIDIINEFSRLSAVQNKADVFPTLWEDIKKFNVELTPKLYSALVTSVFKHDASLVSTQQLQQSRLDQEKLYAKHSKSIDRSIAIRSLTRKIMQLKSTSVFSLGCEIFEYATTANIRMSLYAYNAFIQSCALRGETLMAEDAYSGMINAGHSATTETYTSMINVYGIAGDAFNAQVWFEKYIELSQTPETMPFLAFSSALAICGRLPAAIDVLVRLMPSAMKSVSIKSINELLSLLDQRLDFEGMQLLYDTLSKSPELPNPSPKTYSLMMNAALINGNLNEALGYYSRTEISYLPPYCIGLLGSTSADIGDLDLSLKLAKELLSRNQIPEISHVVGLVQGLYNTDPTGARSMEFLKIIISKFINRSGNIAPSASIDRGLTALITCTATNSNIRCALDAFLFAEAAKVYLSQPFAFAICMTFKKATPDAIAQLTAVDYHALFDCAFSHHNPRSEISSQIAVRLFVKKVFSSMILHKLEPTQQIHETVCKGFDNIRDSMGKAEWLVLVRPYNFDTIPSAALDVEKKTSSILKQWRQPTAPPVESTHNDESKSMIAQLEIHCATFEIKEALSLFKRISDAGQKISLSVLQSLMNSLAKSKDHASIREVIDISTALAQTYNTELAIQRAQTAIYELAISAYLNARDPVMALEMTVEAVKKYGKIPKIGVCLALFKRFDRFENISVTLAKHCTDLFQPLIAECGVTNLTPDVFSYMFRVHCITNNIVEAKSLLDLMKKHNLHVSGKSLEHLVHLYVKADLQADSLDAFDQYLDMTPVLSISVFNDILKMYIKNSKDITGAMGIWRVSRQRNVAPDANTLIWLLSGLVDLSNDVGSAKKLFDALTSPAGAPGSAGFAIQPSIIHYDILLSGYARAEQPDMDAILELYEDIQQKKCSPTVMTFENVISGVCRAADGSIRIAEQIRNLMFTHKFSSTPEIENSIMELYWKLGDQVGAFQIFDRLTTEQDADLQPNIRSYQIMITGLVKCGQRERAAALLDRARRHGGYPQTAVDELEQIILQ